MPVEAAQTAAVAALIETQSQARAQLNATVMASVVAQVRAFRGWWNSSSITGLAQKLARITSAGQRRIAISTNTYGTRVLTEMLGTSVRPPGLIDVSQARGGVPLDSVYGRLADEYRYLTATRSPQAATPALRASGEPLPALSPEQILDRIVQRAEAQVQDNLGVAFRQQWAAVTDAAPTRVIGYRRVLHPELAVKTGLTCGLCIVASDHIYNRGELLPIHTFCHCTVSPIVDALHGEGDPGSAINQMDLSTIYDVAGSTLGKDLRKTKFRIVAHPELGPTLVHAGQNHRDAADVAASTDHAGGGND